jgi:colicin import membrane protein
MIKKWSIFTSLFKEEKSGKMMILSLLLHLLVFSTVLFGPYTGVRLPAIEDRTYHVDLVEPPSKPGKKTEGKGPSTEHVAKKGSHKPDKTVKKTTVKAKRITTGKEKPVHILAKRVSPKSVTPPAKESKLASELINKAIEKIEKSAAQEEEQKQVKEALNKIEKRVTKEKQEAGESEAGSSEEGSGQLNNGGKGLSGGGGSLAGGTSIQLYQMEVENTIKNNWSYPAALSRMKETKSPEAVIIVSVKSDGKILKISFKEKSNNQLFDSSVLKAIEKSDPLPQFPPGYVKTYDEIEIKFNLNDLAQ